MLSVVSLGGLRPKRLKTRAPRELRMLLSKYLQGPVTVSRGLVEDEASLQAHIERLLQMFAIKQRVLYGVHNGESIRAHIHNLAAALKEELDLISQSEHEEKEIMLDLKYLSRDEYIKRIDEICSQIRRARDQDQYVAHVLDEISDVLKSQAHKVHRLLRGDHDSDLEETLRDLLLIEKHLFEKLSMIDDFKSLFQSISVGECREHEISRIRKRLTKSLQERMRNIELDENGVARSTDGKYLSGLTARVFNEMEGTVLAAIRAGKILNHPEVDIEFVQSRHFEEFVRQTILADKSAGQLVPRERTIQEFISIFRNLYPGGLQ